MRGQGRVFRPKVGGKETQVWWLDYGLHGKRFRESSGVTSKRDALELLRQRVGKRRDGTLSGRPERVTLADLKTALQRHYVREGNASWPRAEQAFAHLETFFGEGAKALSITRASVADYQDFRLNAGAARNTVRYEVGVLSAAFGVAVELDMLAAKPVFKQLAEGEKRAGFFEPGDFAALIVGLPAEVAALVRFLRLTGWRRGKVQVSCGLKSTGTIPSIRALMRSRWPEETQRFGSLRVRPKAGMIESFRSRTRPN